MRKTMRKSIFILMLLSLHYFAGSAIAKDPELKEITKSLTEALPASWKILSVVPDVIPDWSFTDDKCTQIIVYGQSKSGYEYYGLSGNRIGERRIFNEAIMLWVGDKNFNPNTSTINRIKNKLNKVPKNLPELLYQIRGYSIYARTDTVVLPENETSFKTSPEGTNSAVPIDFEKGRTWPSWQEDMLRKLKEDF